ncbi:MULTISPECIES: ABC transporter permease [Vitreoscilla]|uniref:ABC transporter permease n=1 Tax=Vitreoscilla stercoraria TaxID=61 RepID=A0ABY4E7L4_VITST|nr:MULTISPECIES: ABC transporter permease [Vitreoscilla]AUZ04973.1 inner membrane ABC transporter permease protein YejE [Vitreoscilla sp. C1]UOO91385.1 ABC transporter permease [Vitreoscilla stercoraria]
MLAFTRSRAWQQFKNHRRGMLSLKIFICLFALSLLAPLWSNDQPLWVQYEGKSYQPIVNTYLETEFGGDFETPTDYLDPFIKQRLQDGDNWAVYPLNPYAATTLNDFDFEPFPAAPSKQHWLGTDDRGRDVLARLVYGFRDSVVFGLVLTLITTVIGLVLGAIQGYFGGKVDLIMQRFMEVWGGLPELYLLIILASFFEPSLLTLLVLLSLFSWMDTNTYIRAEFLKNRQMDYVQVARAMGASHTHVMLRHILPNSLTPVIALLPFKISGAILALTSLDFLGLGVASHKPSLGELLAQSKDNLDAWWIGVPTFMTLVCLLLLLIFIGEALRAALDVRRSK